MTLDELKETTKMISDLYLDAIQKRCYYEYLMNTEPLKKSYDGTYEGNGYWFVTTTLYLDLSGNIAALVCDNTNDTASVPHIMRELEKKQVYDALKGKFHVVTDSIDDVYDGTFSNWEALTKMEEYGKIKKLRNKYLSHNAKKNKANTWSLHEAKDFKLKYGSNGIIMDKIEPIIKGIDSLIRGTDFLYDNSVKIYHREASRFWECCYGPNKDSESKD